MKNTPLVSIICPVYNTEKVLGKCVRSIIQQDYRAIEVILVNDGSTDGCLHICEKYAKRDERIRVMDKANGGRILARKDGVLLAKGEYVLFIDCDDYLEKNAISKLVSLAQEFKLDMVVGNHDKVLDDWGIVSRKKRLFTNPGELIGNKQLVEQMLSLDQKGKMDVEVYIWGRLYRRSCITAALKADETHLFPPGKDLLLEDISFNLTIVPFIQTCMVTNDVVYHYRWGGASSRFAPFMKKGSYYFEYRYEKCQENNRLDLLPKAYSHFKTTLCYEVYKRMYFNIGTKKDIQDFIAEELSTSKIARWALENLPSTITAEVGLIFRNAAEREARMKKRSWERQLGIVYKKIVDNISYYINR